MLTMKRVHAAVVVVTTQLTVYLAGHLVSAIQQPLGTSRQRH